MHKLGVRVELTFVVRPLHGRAGTPQAPLMVAPPVAHVTRVTNFPQVRATNEREPLSKVLRPGLPTVMHLFTG